MSPKLTALSERLGHNFSESHVLSGALRHSSLSIKGPEGSFERYEFLGDRVFGLVIAELLLCRFPEENEGDIAKRHAALVRQEALVRVAIAIELGDFVDMSRGEELSGGRTNAKVLSDCCEAVIGALYIDGGLPAAKSFIETHWNQLIEETPEPPKDSKTALQEWAQARTLPIPEYVEISRKGPDHKPTFIIEASVDGCAVAQATGASKQKAEQEVAKKLLKKLNND
jgi:ribonuclease-3